MSKYIRTKDGIYEAVIKDFKGNFDENEICILVEANHNHQYYLLKKDIIAQADTIEELCDGFYIDVLGDGAFNFDGLYVYNDFDDFKEHYISYYTYDDVENGYGFIKTSKGLIYVAKLIDGELVLI